MNVLRLIPQYREMEADLDEAGARAIRAEERARSKEEECRWLKQQLDLAREERVEAQREAALATQALANFGTQRVFGFKIYPDAQGIPVAPSVEQKPGTLRNARTSEARSSAIADFKAEALKQWDQFHGVSPDDPQ